MVDGVAMIIPGLLLYVLPEEALANCPLTGRRRLYFPKGCIEGAKSNSFRTHSDASVPTYATVPASQDIYYLKEDIPPLKF